MLGIAEIYNIKFTRFYQKIIGLCKYYVFKLKMTSYGFLNKRWICNCIRTQLKKDKRIYPGLSRIPNMHRTQQDLQIRVDVLICNSKYILTGLPLQEITFN